MKKKMLSIFAYIYVLTVTSTFLKPRAGITKADANKNKINGSSLGKTAMQKIEHFLEPIA